ncbi:MAG TPA: tRNA 2-thiouridine(34) synthase MnmA [Solirubrobacteraceae bacterium]
MPDERFEEHLHHPCGRGLRPAGSHDAVAGAVACGDVVRISVAIEGDRVRAAGFDAEGCGATLAAASAAVALVEGAQLLDAARVGVDEVCGALGGLSLGKRHAADLAADALARALGTAARADARLAPDAGRTLVAMSGGVDSAVAAILCARDAGAAPVAVTLELWRDAHNDAAKSCCSASAVREARALAHRMGMAHLTVDLREEFRAGVVDPWIADHAAGLTPNPCVRCNGGVRLDAMLDLAGRLGARHLATGHYARVGDDGLLRSAADGAKDQSYMLAALARASIARLRFPLGELTKPQVRELAERERLPVARKPDSQDLCFLAGTGREAFLARHGGPRERPGRILDGAGHTVGRHRGAHGYTVGQRRGVGIGGAGEPLYVTGTDIAANTVTVGPRSALRTDRVRVTDVRLHVPAEEVAEVRLRYRSRPVACTVRGEELELAEPVWGAAPGQTAVFLRGDRVLGCATIAP